MSLVTQVNSERFDRDNLTYDNKPSYRCANGTTALTGWAINDQDRIRESYNASRARENFPALVEIARSKGFRPATLSELFSAAGYGHDYQDIFTWQGMCWVKVENH